MNIRYQKICSNLLKDLDKRTSDIIERRFGLKNGERETLEAIGRTYKITRERVRQIEDEGISKIKGKLKNYQRVIKCFNDALNSMGGLKREDLLLSCLGGKKYKNHTFFLMVLDDGFKRYAEDNDFYSFWIKEKDSEELAKKVVKVTLNNLEKEKRPFNLEDLFRIQKTALSKFLNQKANKDVFASFIEISKKIQKDHEGKIGLSHWVEINPRGIKDKAYLVLKNQGAPLHFSKVAAEIEKSPYFKDKKVHKATVHNELIKDSRFVLVGRGLYALSEWGYQPGVVKDVISKILKDSKKSLSQQEVLEQVLKQRFVKANTVLLNLQDRNYFSKDAKGRYGVRRA